MQSLSGLAPSRISACACCWRGASMRQPVTGLSLNAGATYADSYFPNSSENRAVLTPAADLERLPGHRLSLAPLWSVTWGGAYEQPVYHDLWINLALNAKNVSSYNTGSDLDPVKRQGAFQLWDGTIGIGPHDGRWNLSFWRKTSSTRATIRSPTMAP